MTSKTILASAAILALAPAAGAQEASGDASAGEALFRQCIACHVVADDAGELLAGRGRPNQTAPNLYGIAGRTAGTVEGFARYSESMVAAGEAGLVWDEARFSAYVQDPTGFLREFLDDGSARGNMAFRVRSDEDALNLWAYLVSVAE